MDATSLYDDLRVLRGLAGLFDHRKPKKLRAEEDALMKAAVSIVFDDDELEAIEAQRARPGKGPGSRPGGSNAKGRADYSMSTWAKMLRDDAAELERPESSEAALFRRRFRVPYPVFKLLLEWTREWHEKSGTDCTGRARIPTELKLLGVLRVLGRATCFDGIFELSGISIASMDAFFHKFTEWFRSELYPKFVFTPKTMTEVAEIQAAYAALGLPGCIGSMDVVHVAWCMCPTWLANLATGKEGYPSIAYNVICDHEGRAMSVLPGAYGATSDKTIVRFDGFVDEVRCDPFFTEMQYALYKDADGAEETEKGAWLLIDGGYHKWAVTQAASKMRSDPDYVAWRKQMESVRKDIECFFGRMKARWRMLKTPISFHDKDHVDNAFFTCVGLQNIIHDWDKSAGQSGLATWEVGVDWAAGAHGDFVDEDEDDGARLWSRPKLRTARREAAGDRFFTPPAADDFSKCGSISFPVGAVRHLGHKLPEPGEGARHDRKQLRLVDHFKHAKARGEVTWLRS